MPPATPTVTRRKSRNLSTELVDALTRQIRSGELSPGQKLPTEAAIMEAFSVSRTVVREAISRLQASGLAETRHGIGTFVLAQALQEPGGFRITSDQLATLRDVIALLELRIGIETEAAALAAVRRQEEHLRNMAQALKAFASAIEHGESSVSADFQFHQEIARATGNPHFIELLSSLGPGVIPRSRLASAMPPDHDRLAYLRRVHQEHESIYHAIAAQDVEAARAGMRTHLSNSRERWRRGENLQH